MMQDGPRGEAFGGMRHSELPLFQADELVQCKNCKRMLVLGSFQEHQVGPVQRRRACARPAVPRLCDSCPFLLPSVGDVISPPGLLIWHRQR